MSGEKISPTDNEIITIQSVIKDSGGVLIVRIDVYDRTGRVASSQPVGRFRVISKSGINPSVYKTFDSATEAWGWMDAIDRNGVSEGAGINEDFLNSAYESEQAKEGFEDKNFIGGEINILRRPLDNLEDADYALSQSQFKNKFLLLIPDENLSTLLGCEIKEALMNMLSPEGNPEPVVSSVFRWKMT
ncbi:hypothetical protein [Xanthomonas fragariae]|uniref:hypothetical protein n=1 Tax=Xanthomonas fragariae TaxID=48664 RepID=UPI000D560FE4|nr:hypothetical protein [Xanthomonas fragariae]MDM7555202.1 hypothetical protein [Xanthomonas fragariae]MDM7558316.1 hypothetical protein [Xanthomonas fragariae]MDM7576010.1 hypothetical protein [Xanthomonas fragariae]MDM7579090.1 hypothetical protein [Xanthomonas fragariae]MDM7589313.1 hypothetical protein [Xanthomonas fragariae]